MRVLTLTRSDNILCVNNIKKGVKVNFSIPTSPGKRPFDELFHPGFNSPEKGDEVQQHTGLTDDVKRVKIERVTRCIPLESGTNLLFSKIQKVKAIVASIVMQDSSIFLNNKIYDSVTALGVALNPAAPLDDRILMHPVRVPDCANGCYFLKNQRGENVLVVKPASQERGNLYCPISSEKAFDGITPGQGALKEWLAWKIQSILDVDFGVPETTLIEMKHPYFLDHKTNRVLEALTQLNSHVNMKNGKEWTEVEFLKCMRQAQGQLPALTQLVLNRDRALNLGDDFIFFCQYNKPPKCLKEVQNLLTHNFPSQNFRQLIPHWDTLYKQRGMEAAVQKLYEAFIEDAINTTPSLVSAQCYMQGYEQDIESVGGVENILPSQFWKFAIDLILFNCDRHMGNILVKDNGLLLIDHGISLPDPLFKENGKGIKEPRFDFLDFPQVNSRIEGPIKEAFHNLNIPQVLETLEGEIKGVQTLFPHYSKEFALTPDHFTFLRFSLRFLQKGIEKGRTLKEMGMDYVEGRAQSILIASLTPDYQLNTLVLEGLL